MKRFNSKHFLDLFGSIYFQFKRLHWKKKTKQASSSQHSTIHPLSDMNSNCPQTMRWCFECSVIAHMFRLRHFSSIGTKWNCFKLFWGLVKHQFMELEVFKVPSLSDFKKTSLELRELRGRWPRPWHQLVKPKETDTLLHSHQWEDTVFCPSSWQPELPVLPFPVGHRNVWIFSTLQDVLFQFRLQLEVPTKLHTGTFSPFLETVYIWSFSEQRGPSSLIFSYREY